MNQVKLVLIAGGGPNLVERYKDDVKKDLVNKIDWKNEVFEDG